MMKESKEKRYYSIGETANICGVSVQTLRFYSKMHLISPAYINKESGYRYYLPEQFQLIDRTKYLQKFGFSLQEIQAIYKNGSIDYLQQCLEKQKQKIIRKREFIDTLAREIDWYCSYFQPMTSSPFSDIPVRQHYEERYVLMESASKHEPLNQVYQRLLRKKNQPGYRDLLWRFHFCTVIDFQDFCHNMYSPLSYGIFLAEKPRRDYEHVITLPAGEYLCVQMKLHTSDWDAGFIRHMFENRSAPQIVFAAEIENSMVDFQDSLFVVQMYIGT